MTTLKYMKMIKYKNRIWIAQLIALLNFPGCDTLLNSNERKDMGGQSGMDQGGDSYASSRDGVEAKGDGGSGDQGGAGSDRGSAITYLMQDFWPLKKGNTWSYLKSNSVAYTQTVVDPVTINGIQAIKLDEVVDGSEDGTHYTLWTDDQEGYKMHKSVTGSTATGYSLELMFSPVLSYYPYQLAVGTTHQQTHNYTSKDSNGYTGIGVIQETLVVKGVEAITVKAGSFDTCLKMVLCTENTVTIGSTPALTESREGTFWFCKNVGMVKATEKVWWSIGGSQEIEKELQSAQVNGVSYPPK